MIEYWIIIVNCETDITTRFYIQVFKEFFASLNLFTVYPVFKNQGDVNNEQDEVCQERDKHFEQYLYKELLPHEKNSNSYSLNRKKALLFSNSQVFKELLSSYSSEYPVKI